MKADHLESFAHQFGGFRLSRRAAMAAGGALALAMGAAAAPRRSRTALS